MKSIVNRRGSKAATRALKRLGCPPRVSNSKAANPQTSVRTCSTCANTGWETMDKGAACNCCEGGKFYIPMKITPAQEE